jgi:2-oxoisovalerate dehydrogenase E1 component
MNHPPTDQYAAGSVTELELLESMLVIRQLELSILDLRNRDEVAGSVHLCIGQESAPVGVLACLGPNDQVLATYRGHGWAIACGVPPAELLAEVLGRSAGTNGGRGGSAFLSSPKHRFVGENSIVGAGLPIANGVAMALEATQSGGICVVSFGDGATNQGASHEALVFAVARRLPVVFVCENNEWSEMTPISATVPNSGLAERAAAYGLPAEEVDGSNILQVMDAAKKAVQRARNGEGPTFLEVKVPRILGHYNGDVEQYRSQPDKESHAQRDPIVALEQRLLANGVEQEQLTRVHEYADAIVQAARSEALQSTPADPETAHSHVVSTCEESVPRPLPSEGREIAYGLAVNLALTEELEARPEMIVFGEDIAIPGGPFGVTRNLHKRFGGERVFDTPISEAAILGAAIGASQFGLRPVVEIMWSDFLFVAFDQILNQAANVRYLSRGEQSVPMVVRMQQGMTPGSCAQHCQSLESMLTHVPGIKVGLPSTAQDAYAMLRAAIADPDPVFVIESRALYQLKGVVDTSIDLEPVFGARRRRDGADLAIITWGRITNTVLEAAEVLSSHGVEASVLDLRWLSPLDDDAIERVLQESAGKALIVHEANQTGGFGAEVAARIVDKYFFSLDGPVERIGLPDVRVPAAPTLQAALLPSVDRIVTTATRVAAS